MAPEEAEVSAEEDAGKKTDGVSDSANQTAGHEEETQENQESEGDAGKQADDAAAAADEKEPLLKTEAASSSSAPQSKADPDKSSKDPKKTSGKEDEKENKVSLAKALMAEQNRAVARTLVLFATMLAVVPLLGMVLAEMCLRGVVEDSGRRWTYSGIVAVMLVNVVAGLYVVVCFREENVSNTTSRAATVALKSAEGEGSGEGTCGVSSDAAASTAAETPAAVDDAAAAAAASKQRDSWAEMVAQYQRKKDS